MLIAVRKARVTSRLTYECGGLLRSGVGRKTEEGERGDDEEREEERPLSLYTELG